MPKTLATAGRLQGLRAIVTGGARGIGAGISRRLHAEGARLAVLDLRQELGEAITEEISGSFHRVDLADPVATRAAVGAAIESLGGADVLVNSAGVLSLCPLQDLTVDEWDRVMNINARATLVTMQAVFAEMVEAGGGRIVNLASMAAKVGGEDEAHYAASKAAVVALTRVAAMEWGRYAITVNAICPGYVLTEMGAGTRTPDDIAAWTALSPLGRLGTPDDVAGLVAYLASPDGSYITGQALNVTGGMVMH